MAAASRTVVPAISSEWKCGNKHRLLMHDVFINYRVATDKDIAEKLAYAIAAEQKSVFLDKFCLVSHIIFISYHIIAALEIGGGEGGLNSGCVQEVEEGAFFCIFSSFRGKFRSLGGGGGRG